MVLGCCHNRSPEFIEFIVDRARNVATIQPLIFNLKGKQNYGS